jgi:hypothetical protein
MLPLEYLSEILTDRNLIKTSYEDYEIWNEDGWEWSFDYYFYLRQTEDDTYHYFFSDFIIEKVTLNFLKLLSEYSSKPFDPCVYAYRILENSLSSFDCILYPSIVDTAQIEHIREKYGDLLSDFYDLVQSKNPINAKIKGKLLNDSIHSFRLSHKFINLKDDIIKVINELADEELLVEKRDVELFYKIISQHSINDLGQVKIIGGAANFKLIWDLFFQRILKNSAYSNIENNKCFLKESGKPFKANDISNASGKGSPPKGGIINEIIKKFTF